MIKSFVTFYVEKIQNQSGILSNSIVTQVARKNRSNLYFDC